METTAALVTKVKNNFEIVGITLNEPKANEIQVRIVASGICHTDEAGRTGVAHFPVVLGHEGAGIVEKVGNAVEDFNIGDHVVLTIPSCGECEYCKSKKAFACKKNEELIFGGKMKDGTTRISFRRGTVNHFFGQSSFSKYVIVDARSAVKVDKDVELSLLGPLGCGFQTGAGTVLGFLKAQKGSSIVVFGCGAVGFSAIMAAKIAGCSQIIAVGGNDDKLQLAKELGATHIVNRKNTKDISAVIRKMTGALNYALDTSGAPEMIDVAIKSLDKLGHLVLVGMGSEITINPVELMVDSISISAIAEGCVNPYEFIPQLVSFYKQGIFPIDKLVTYYEFDQINKAFEDLRNGAVIKPILKISEV
ncbi:MAG: NAD(P)-dependent alcohol dehydrogenase [Lachnospiraceae bacterium]|nr:NAD(P)-dependent alcohol dehydrogenase [Lachnospiraceae bacterium]